MPVTYDLVLVAVSIMVAVVGAHAGFAVMRRDGRFARMQYKMRLLLSAVVFGGSIWAMHFIGMHAVQLPIVINYAVLPTFVSALVAILLTGLGLYIATSGVVKRHPRKIAALLMGAGVTSMHYLGIGAIRAACVVETSVFGGLGALAVGVLVSWVGLRMMTGPRQSEANTLRAALLLGVAIAGMHYVAMADTRFLLGSGVELTAEPVLNEYYLASLAAFLAFLICDLFIFIVLPEPTGASPFRDTPEMAIATDGGAETRNDDAPPANAGSHIRVEGSSGLQILPVGEILRIKADGHYSEIAMFDPAGGRVKTVHASESIAQLQDRLPKARFLRVHRSYVVNIDHVAQLDRGGGVGRLRFSAVEDFDAPVSRSYLKIVVGRLSAAT